MYLIPAERRDAVAQALRDLPGGLSVHFEKDAAPRPVAGMEGLRAAAAELEDLARTVTINCDVVSTLLDMSCRIYPESRSGDDVLYAANTREDLRVSAMNRMGDVWMCAAMPCAGLNRRAPFEIYAMVCRLDKRCAYVDREVSLIIAALTDLAAQVRAAAAAARGRLDLAEKLLAVEPMRKSA